MHPTFHFSQSVHIKIFVGHNLTDDTEGIVNYMLALQGIKLTAIVIDRDDKWRFRNKGKFDVNTFARKYFNGRGCRITR